MVMGLLSPRGSQFTTTPVAGTGLRTGDATKLKEELDEDLVLCVVSF